MSGKSGPTSFVRLRKKRIFEYSNLFIALQRCSGVETGGRVGEREAAGAVVKGRVEGRGEVARGGNEQGRRGGRLVGKDWS